MNVVKEITGKIEEAKISESLVDQLLPSLKAYCDDQNDFFQTEVPEELAQIDKSKAALLQVLGDDGSGFIDPVWARSGGANFCVGVKYKGMKFVMGD